MRVVKVPLGNRSYALKIGEGLLTRLGYECDHLKLGERCAIITDTNVGRRYARPAFDSLAKAGFSPFGRVIVTGSGKRPVSNAV